MPENETNVKGFFLYFDQCEAIFALPDEQALQTIKACYAYMRGDEPDLTNPVVNCVFQLVRPALELSKKRASYGRRGGQANGKQSEANDSNQEANCKQTASKGEANGSHLKTKTKTKNQELENTPPPTPLKGGGGDTGGEKPSRTRESAAAIREAIEGLDVSPSLRQALHEFAASRERGRHPLTVAALRLTLRELDKLARTDAERVAIVEQSIQRGWQGVFALADATGTPRQTRASPSPGRLTGEDLTRHNMAVAAQVMAELEAEKNTVEVYAHG